MGREKQRRLQVETLEHRYCLDACLDVLGAATNEPPSPTPSIGLVGWPLPAAGEEGAPRVVAVSPASGATVSSLQTVTIDFSHPMQPVLANNRAHYLVVVGNVSVPVTAASYQETGNQYRVTLTMATGSELPVGQVRVSVDGRALRTTTGEMLGSSEDELLVLLDDQDVSGVIGRDPNGNLTLLHSTPLDGLDKLPVLENGDLNRDGYDDLITVDASRGDVVILYGSSSGKFSTPVRLHLPDNTAHSVAAEPMQVVVARWNADQHPDLVILDNGQGYRRLHLYVNDGAGNFTAAPETPIPMTGDTYGTILGVADFTSDGQNDIAVQGPNLPNNHASVAIYAKDPFLGYSVAATLSTGNQNWSPMAGKIADLNGDGRADLIVETSGYYLADPPTLAFLSTPTGLAPAFSLPYDHLQGGQVAIGDFNTDGHLDVLVVHDRYRNSEWMYDGGVISLMLGNSQGSFTWGEDQLIGRRGATLRGVADMSNDGHLDLVMIVGQWEVQGTPHLSSWVFLGDGAGNFTPASVEPVPIQPLDAGGVPSVVLTDVTADGYLDAVLAHESGSLLRMLPNNGAGRLLGGSSPAVLGATPKLDSGGNTLYADFNHDGYTDMATFVPGSPAQIVIFLGNVEGALLPAYSLPTMYAGQGWLQVGDLNRDGRLDIVASYGEHGVGVWLGQGDGNFAPVSGAPIAAGSTENYLDLNDPGVLVDVNGDGKLDLLVMLSIYSGYSIVPRGFAVYFGDGTGKLIYNQNTYFTFPTGYSLDGLRLPVRPVVRDFDGDGKVDLLLSTRDHSDSEAVAAFVVYRGNGNGTFTPSVTTPIPAYPYDPVVAYAAGDFNHDGHLDVIGVIPWYNEFELFLGDGQGRFTLAPNALQSLRDFRDTPDTNRRIHNLEFGDFDGDGDLDAALSLRMRYVEPIALTQRVAIFRNDGQGMFGPAQAITLAGVPVELQAMPKEQWLLAGTFNYQGNRAPTNITLSRATVFANLPGAWVAAIGVVDPDSLDTHQWTTSDPRFEVRNGQLYLKAGQSISAGAGTQIPLTLTATDNGAPAKSLSRTFNLLVQARPANWTAAHQWAPDPLDVNADGVVSPLDALLIINQLNATGVTSVTPGVPGTISGPLLDVSGDNEISAYDAVLIINSLNALGARTSIAATGISPLAPAGEETLVAGEDPATLEPARVDTAIAEWFLFDATEQRRKSKSSASPALSS